MNPLDFYEFASVAQVVANVSIIALACHFCGDGPDFRRYRFRWRSRRSGFDLAEHVTAEYPLIMGVLTAYPPTREDLKLVRDLACRYRWEIAKQFDDGVAVANSEPRRVVRECELLLERWG